MKVLIDGTMIPAYYYYYLLEFRDRHFDTYESIVGIPATRKIISYSIEEFLKAFSTATKAANEYLNEETRKKNSGTNNSGK